MWVKFIEKPAIFVLIVVAILKDKRVNQVRKVQSDQRDHKANKVRLDLEGLPGGVLAFADFYALMPSDNSATVAPGTDVEYPQDGPNSGTGINRTGPSSFNLTDIGFYQILFQVSVGEAGQLILTLNGEDLDYTVVGRATGTSQIVEMAIVETTSVNSILTVQNPAGNSTALTITPLAGGTRPVSAHLVITRLQ